MLLAIKWVSMGESQPSDQSGDAIARVYENGEHVADIVSERLLHEFDESPTYEVERLEAKTEAITA